MRRKLVSEKRNWETKENSKFFLPSTSPTISSQRQNLSCLKLKYQPSILPRYTFTTHLPTQRPKIWKTPLEPIGCKVESPPWKNATNEALSFSRWPKHASRDLPNLHHRARLTGKQESIVERGAVEVAHIGLGLLAEHGQSSNGDAARPPVRPASGDNRVVKATWWLEQMDNHGDPWLIYG